MNNNILYAIGDILIINVNPKITGKVSFSDFSDVVEGVTISRTLIKEFRVSTDKIFWSDWKILSTENISSEEYIVDDILTIQLRYTRTGTDNTGEIEFKGIDFIGSREEIQFIAPTVTSSIFSSIIGTSNLKKIEQNIFKKFYFRGILPSYITRAENLNQKEDKDFIDLFFSIARFFSLLICFFKRFENFKNDYDLMREQVKQYGIYFNESDITLEKLQYLSQNIYDQIRQRGTDMIYKREGFILSNGGVLKIDGEFIRLIRSKVSDELLYEKLPSEKVGWCLGQSSPMYRGTAQAYNLNKTKENSQDFQNLNNFLLNKEGISDFTLATDNDDKKILKLEATFGITGLGRIEESQEIFDKIYVVDSRMDYEITFAFKLVSGTSNSVEIRFGVEGFDVSKNKLNDAFTYPNGSISGIFFDKQTTNLKTSCWYFARGIIHAYSSSNLNESVTNLGFGTNLYFNNSFVKYILPKIQLISNNGVTSELQIWNYKIRPLVRGTNIIPLKNGVVNSHSLGFIQSSEIFYSYFRNNNNNQSQEEITDIIEKYLLPYNVTDIFVFIK